MKVCDAAADKVDDGDVSFPFSISTSDQVLLFRLFSFHPSALFFLTSSAYLEGRKGGEE